MKLNDEIRGIITSNALHRYPDDTYEVDADALAQRITHHIAYCAGENIKNMVEQYEAYQDDYRKGVTKWQCIERIIKWSLAFIVLLPIIIELWRKCIPLA